MVPLQKDTAVSVGIGLLIIAAIVAQFQYSFEADNDRDSPPPRHEVRAWPRDGLPAKLRWTALEDNETRTVRVALPPGTTGPTPLPRVGELIAGTRVVMHERVKKQPVERPVKRPRVEPEEGEAQWDGSPIELATVSVSQRGNEAGIVVSFAQVSITWPSRVIISLDNTVLENRGWYEAREIARSRRTATYLIAAAFALLGLVALGSGIRGYVTT